MDLDQQLNPWVATAILSVLTIVVVVVFWASGQESKSRVGSYFLEHDRQGSLSLQMDHMLIRLSASGQLISSLDLRQLGGDDVMGNVAYFDNGDILFRAGEPESGLKSYMSLGQLPPTLSVSGGLTKLELDLDEAERVRQLWVDDLDVQSGLNRCNPMTGECRLLDKEWVPWRYRLRIDEADQRIYFSEGSKHRIQVLDLEGHPIERLPGDFKYPKRVRLFDNEHYVIDTNNHRLLFIDKDSAERRYQKVVPNNVQGRQWPIDALFFDRHWWVVNADSGMTDSHLHKFDSDWNFVERVALIDDADPLDLIIYDGKLLVSDVRLGNLYVFDDASSVPQVRQISDVVSYIDFLSEQRQFFSALKVYVIVGGGLLIILLFALVVALQSRR